MFDRKALAEADVPAVQDLFSRIVEAEKDQLTEAQKADPRGYLLGAWRAAAETVMRPLHRVEDLAEELATAREQRGDGFYVDDY